MLEIQNILEDLKVILGALSLMKAKGCFSYLIHIFSIDECNYAPLVSCEATMHSIGSTDGYRPTIDAATEGWCGRQTPDWCTVTFICSPICNEVPLPLWSQRDVRSLLSQSTLAS
jgi:hypothetical protein